MKRKNGLFGYGAALIMACGLVSHTAFANEAAQSDAQSPRVYFINLKDGQTVKSPVTILFGLENFGVAPAGVEKAGTGHHHLLIDSSLTEEDRLYPLPADDRHIHFGGGQTQTTLDLAPGTHTLQLVLGDQNHVPLKPSIESERITITVK